MEPWIWPFRGVQETDREAPPSVILREDFWQVTLLIMMETGQVEGDCLQAAQLKFG